jgi:hypothetical protein
MTLKFTPITTVKGQPRNARWLRQSLGSQPASPGLSDQPARVATKRLPDSRSARAVTPVGKTHIRVHEFGDNPLSDLVQGR